MAESSREELERALAEMQRKNAELEARLAAQEGATAVEGERNVMPSGDIEASTVVTGDENVLTDGGASVTGKVDVEWGDFVGRDKTVGGDEVHGSKVEVKVTPEAARSFLRGIGEDLLDDEQLQAASGRYLDYLLDSYRYLDFKGMGMSDRVPLRLPLTQMYVPLRARVEMPDGETWARRLAVAGRMASEEEAAAIGERVSDPQPLLGLLEAHDGLVVLGDPGAGKTTFLKYLTLLLAMGKGAELGLAGRLPILVPLSAYANALAKQDVPLQDFLGQYYHDQGINLPVAALLARALERGMALVMFDGLDEVQELSRRTLVVRRVTAFFRYHRRTGNKFLVTSRIVGYREVRLVSEGLGECTLVDFDDDDIAEFVAKWTRALEQAVQGAGGLAVRSAQREEQELLEAARGNPSVHRLATNPLLLTILALMKRQGVTLPERRVELYDKYIETLLRHWNLARGLDGRNAHDVDPVEAMRILAPLALWMHETSPGVGLVKREAMRRQLISIYRAQDAPNPTQMANQLLIDAREHAGLLLERGRGEYGFIHLTFQEYLAGVGIAQLGETDITPIVEKLARHVDEDAWHEASLLTIGYLGIIQQRPKAAGEALGKLMDQGPGPAGAAAALAGEAVLDAWPAGVSAQCKQAVVEGLLATIDDDKRVAPATRARAGSALGALGDPRPGVGVADGLPDIAWLPVEGGTFTMGGDGQYDGKPVHRVAVADFRMAKYPVTNEQYAAFVQATGYAAPRHWTTDRPPAQLRNHPVVNVSWEDAIAYCDWLSEVRGERVRLPSEAEWEKAARGDQDRRPYPWGDEEPDANRCNFSRNIGSTTPVGIYPAGESPYGCLDMAGNVWEWTLSLYQEYPYDPDDGREDAAASGRRVVRGGAFYNLQDLVRCAYRSWNDRDSRSDALGFRLLAPGL